MANLGDVSVTSGRTSASVTVTRPADTADYAANDVIGAATGSTAALTFEKMGAPFSTIEITDTTFLIALAAVISGMTSYTLHLYSVTPPSALGDNVAFDIPSGDRASYLGSVTLGTPTDRGASLYIQTTGIAKTVTLGASGSLFGYLVTVGAYTPSSADVHKITIAAKA